MMRGEVEFKVAKCEAENYQNPILSFELRAGKKETSKRIIHREKRSSLSLLVSINVSNKLSALALTLPQTFSSVESRTHTLRRARWFRKLPIRTER